MPRTMRAKSESGVYHAMSRGVNRQSIFEDEEDRETFIDILRTCKELGHFELFAYCLMDNHFHLVLRPNKEEPLETIFRRIGSRYVLYFNRKYGRSGHLFQDRFTSEAVADDAYFLSVVRYVLQNPVKAGICATPFDYPYSSAREYLTGVAGITDTALVRGMLGEAQIADFICQAPEFRHVEVDRRPKLSDAGVREILRDEFGCASASDVQRLATPERNAVLSCLRERGASIRQLSRITGVSEGIIRYR